MDDTLRSYLESMRRHKVVVVLAAVLALASSALAYSRQTATYTAAVDLGPSLSVLSAGGANSNSMRVYALTMSRLMTDESFASRVIGRAGLAMAPQELIGAMQAQASETGDAIGVQVSASSAGQALQLAAAVSEELIASEVSTREEGATGLRNRLEAAAASRKEEAARLTARRRALRGELPPGEEVDLQRALLSYGSLVARLDQLDLDTGGDSRIEMWAPAYIVSSDSPNPVAFAVLGIVVGLVVGGAGAVVMDKTESRVGTASEFSALLRMPVLGTIPRVGKRAGGLDRVIEAWRLIRVRLVQALAEGDQQAVLLVPIAASSDAPLLAKGLAAGLARSGRSVAVVCADPTDGYSLQAAFGYGPYEHGLADVVRGSARANDVLKATDVPGLWLVPTGDMSSGRTELVGTVAMRGLVTELRQRVEIVLVVTDSLDASADPVVALEAANRVVLLGALGKTSRVAIHRCADLLAQTRADVLGLILFESPLEAAGTDV